MFLRHITEALIPIICFYNAALVVFAGGYFTELRVCLGVMRTPPMFMFSVNHFLFCFGQAIVYVHLGAFAETTGILSRSGTATLFSVIGVSNLVSVELRAPSPGSWVLSAEL